MVQEIIDGFAAHKEEWAQIGKDIAMGIWDGLNGLLNKNIEGLKYWSGFDGMKKDKSGSGGFKFDWGVDGSHAGGLSFVPFDGYRAELHKGERVLTRQEADYFRTARDTVTVHKNIQNQFNIQVYAATGQDEEAIAEAVADRVVAKIEQKEAAVA